MPNLAKIQYLKSKEKEICQLYTDGYSTNKIANILNISKSSSKKVLKKYKVKIRDSRTSHLRYTCDECTFETIDSHEKAYWVGFLQADAAIVQNRLVLCLSTKDIDHTTLFKNFMKSDHKILTYKQLQGKSSIIKNKNKDYFYNYFGICSNKLVNDLKKYDIYPNKTKTTTFGKNIPEQYIGSYMAGLVDADGFITITKNKNSIIIGFLGNNFTGPEFNNILQTKIENISNNKLIYKNKINVVVRYAGKQVFEIGKFLYENTKDFLPRKKNKILDFFKKDSF